MKFTAWITNFVIILAFVGCSSSENGSKRNSPESGDNSSQQKTVYLNTVQFSDQKFELEVLHLNDEENGIYSEWVKTSNDGNISYSNFIYKYPLALYKKFKSNRSQFLDDLKDPKNNSDYINEDLKSALQQRFNNQITEKDYLNNKKNILSQPKKYKIFERTYLTTGCAAVGNEIKTSLKTEIQSLLKLCQSSKYINLAAEDAKDFLNQGQYLAFKGLFGLMDIFPRLHTVIEISPANTIHLGTIISATSSLLPLGSASEKKVSESTCQGHFVTKSTSDLSMTPNMTFNLEAKSKDYFAFTDTCNAIYKNNSYLISTTLNSSYPDASNFLRNYLAYNIKNLFLYEAQVEEQLSLALDKEIEKSQSLENDSKIIYLNWKTSYFKDNHIPLNRGLLLINNHDDQIENIKNYVLKNRNELKSFGDLSSDGKDLFLQKDLEIIENIKNTNLEVNL